MNSEQEYEFVCDIVHHQTSPKQEPMVEQCHVVNIGTPTLEADTIRSKLTRAVERGDLISDGRRYCSTDPKRVDRAISHVVQQVPVNQSLLGRLNAEQMDS